MSEGVFKELVGQERTVDTLRRAAAGAEHAMTHAWLFTGPPGSGRSNAARAFAAALQCPNGGCGTCTQCRTSLSGAHPDVTLVITEKLSLGLAEARELVNTAHLAPMLRRWQIIVVEDADRLTARAADAMLKSIEEPAARTVWMLCAPSPEDVIVTLRSRCRQVRLSTPSQDAVAQLLVARDGVEPALAEASARLAQGHIGRARGLASSPRARAWRDEIVAIPAKLTSVSACLDIASELVKRTKEEAEREIAAKDAAELEELRAALGVGTKGAKPRNTAPALKALDDQQALRRKRMQRDSLDIALTELTTFYRDVFCVQTSAQRVINEELVRSIHEIAARSTPEQTLCRIDAILAARRALNMNAAPQLALESMLLTLAKPQTACRQQRHANP